MMEKLFQSENGGLIAALLAVVAIFGINECNKTARAGIANDYEMSANAANCGEVRIKPATKKEENTGQTAEDAEKKEEPAELIQSNE